MACPHVEELSNEQVSALLLAEPQWPPPPCPGAEQQVLLLLQQADATDEHEERALHFAEVFAGNGAVSRGMQAYGFRGRQLDLTYHPGHNVLTPAGFLLLLRTVLDIVPGGVLWAAPPCSTWIWLSRSSTRRHLTPEGNRLSRSVVAHDALVERLVLLLEILTLRGCYWIIEQPERSVMWDYPAMQACLQRHGVLPLHLDMGAFGAQSVKPTTLMGTAPYLWVLERRCGSELRRALRDEGVATTTAWVDGEGKRKCQGSAELKGTQVYPEGLGAAHALAFAASFGKPPASAGEPACFGTHSGAASSSSPARAFPRSRAAEFQALLPQLPGAVQASTSGAWWLRDFMGEPW